MKLLTKSTLLMVVLVGLYSPSTFARLKVCNETDLVLMVSVGYNHTDNQIASQGWWKIYPGFCEIPVDVAMLSGDYFVHAESDPRSTMPIDTFTWGSGLVLCVQTQDFRIPDGNFCNKEDRAVAFSKVKKNFRNSNVETIKHSKRRYKHEFATQVAGIQRLLSLLGYDVGVIDGVLGLKTVTILNELHNVYQISPLDFKIVFELLEKLFHL